MAVHDFFRKRWGWLWGFLGGLGYYILGYVVHVHGHNSLSDFREGWVRSGTLHTIGTPFWRGVWFCLFLLIYDRVLLGHCFTRIRTPWVRLIWDGGTGVGTQCTLYTTFKSDECFQGFMGFTGDIYLVWGGRSGEGPVVICDPRITLRFSVFLSEWFASPPFFTSLGIDTQWDSHTLTLLWDHHTRSMVSAWNIRNQGLWIWMVFSHNLGDIRLVCSNGFFTIIPSFLTTIFEEILQAIHWNQTKTRVCIALEPFSSLFINYREGRILVWVFAGLFCIRFIKLSKENLQTAIWSLTLEYTYLNWDITTISWGQLTICSCNEHQHKSSQGKIIKLKITSMLKPYHFIKSKVISNIEHHNHSSRVHMPIKTIKIADMIREISKHQEHQGITGGSNYPSQNIIWHWNWSFYGLHLLFVLFGILSFVIGIT
jgi:hypothetical protein